MQCPPSSGDKYRIYKGTFSLILMALVEGNYNFMYVHVGTPGRAFDVGVFVDTSLYRPHESGELLPKPVPLPGSDVPMNFVIVADDAFPLTNYMMKSFPNRLQKRTPEKAFNYRLFRSRPVPFM